MNGYSRSFATGTERNDLNEFGVTGWGDEDDDEGLDPNPPLTPTARATSFVAMVCFFAPGAFAKFFNRDPRRSSSAARLPVFGVGSLEDA